MAYPESSIPVFSSIQILQIFHQSDNLKVLMEKVNQVLIR